MVTGQSRILRAFLFRLQRQTDTLTKNLPAAIRHRAIIDAHSLRRQTAACSRSANTYAGVEGRD